MRAALVALLVVAGGCGSAVPSDLPPPAGPARSPAQEETPAGRVVAQGRVYRAAPARSSAAVGARVAVVRRRARTLELLDRRTGRVTDRAPAGVGPTRVVADGPHRLFVVDTEGDGLLLFRVDPRLELVRRVALPGDPYGIAIDRRRHRLWVTSTAHNRLVEVTANGRPRLLRSFPSVRQPDDVAVDQRTGRVLVMGDRLQILDP